MEFALSRGEILGLRLSMTGSEGLAMKKTVMVLTIAFMRRFRQITIIPAKSLDIRFVAFYNGK